jgi:hypothetical protein
LTGSPPARAQNAGTAAAASIRQALAEESYLYEFDDVETHIFAAQLDGLPVYGMFENAHQLADGDKVRAVVSGSDDLLYVHSVIRGADDLMLLPYNVYAGEQALVRENKREMWKLIFGTWIFMQLCFVALTWADGTAAPAQDVLMLSIMALVLTAAVGRLGYGSPYQIMPGGAHAQAIFTVYGFPLPDHFNARKGTALFSGASAPFYGTNARLALASHLAAFKLPS